MFANVSITESKKKATLHLMGKFQASCYKAFQLDLLKAVCGERGGARSDEGLPMMKNENDGQSEDKKED